MKLAVKPFTRTVVVALTLKLPFTAIGASVVLSRYSEFTLNATTGMVQVTTAIGAEEQIVALLALLEELRSRYRIPSANFLAHGDIAPARKVDPSRLFPWQRLASHGFGLWCETPAPAAPFGFDAQLGLQALGYDIANAVPARQAFRRHFTGSDDSGELSPGEQALLHCLLQKKAARE